MYFDPNQIPNFERLQFTEASTDVSATGEDGVAFAKEPADSAKLSNSAPSYLGQLGQIVANNQFKLDGSSKPADLHRLSEDHVNGMLGVLGSVYGASGGGHGYGLTG